MAEKPTGNLAAVLIRGLVGITKDTKDALHLLRLRKKNVCVVYPNTPSNQGMLKKCKDYITWGEIDTETETLLKEKRGKKTKNKELKRR